MLQVLNSVLVALQCVAKTNLFRLILHVLRRTGSQGGALGASALSLPFAGSDFVDLDSVTLDFGLGRLERTNDRTMGC